MKTFTVRQCCWLCRFLNIEPGHIGYGCLEDPERKVNPLAPMPEKCGANCQIFELNPCLKPEHQDKVAS